MEAFILLYMNILYPIIHVLVKFTLKIQNYFKYFIIYNFYNKLKNSLKFSNKISEKNLFFFVFPKISIMF